MNKTKVLILGGTGEARELARRSVELFADDAEIISSQAGVTQDPEEVAGRVISGGFGGIQGLTGFIKREQVRVVIDATHPFAETISDNAYIACTGTSALRMMLVRPSWKLPPGGRWVEVEDLTSAAEDLSKFASKALITTGRRGLDAFSHLDDIRFFVRMIEAPDAPLPLKNHQLILARPPFALEAERALLEDHQIDVLVSKHSGGAASMTKITAALDAGIPIILLRRPPRLPGLWTETVDDCLQWLQGQV